MVKYKNLMRAFEYTGLPGGVLNHVMGIGEDAGEALVMHEDVNVISFTGSTQVGTNIAQYCPQHYKRVSLEMGGKNAVIVLSDADQDSALKGILRSVFATTGQRCASAGRIIIEEAIVDSLTQKIVAAATKLRLGNGLNEATEMRPVINHARLAHIHQDVVNALNTGALLLCGGERAVQVSLKNGFFYKPTHLSSVTPEMPIAQEEAFGPVASIIPRRVM